MTQSNDKVWVLLPNGSYYPMGAGISSLKEICKTALLETPHLGKSVCTREILYHTPQLEFEGFRIKEDPVNEYLVNRYLKTGDEAKIVLVIGNELDTLTQNAVKARKITGYVCMENPGTGEGPIGSRIKGKIVYADQPTEGVFYETQRVFVAY